MRIEDGRIAGLNCKAIRSTMFFGSTPESISGDKSMWRQSGDWPDNQRHRPATRDTFSASRIRFGVTALAIASLTACTTLTPDPKPEAPPPVEIDLAALPGDYGLASYHRDEDNERTLEQAKIACRNPYTIGAGANGGVMMHAIGASEPSEIFLKTDSKGRRFLGPQGPAGIAQDRYVVSYDDKVLVLRWMDPRAREVYGTLIYMPCATT